MSEFKVQQIRSCVQCKAVLSLKCKSCLAHPERKPKVIEYYSWPPFLKTSACGCVLIACQLQGCKNTVWRQINRFGKDGTAVSQRLFCSTKCTAIQRNKDQYNRVNVVCAYSDCGKKFTRAPSKLLARACCNQTCYKLYRLKKAHDAREAREALEATKEKKEDFTLQNLYCQKCRNVNIHQAKGNNYRCEVCQTERKAKEAFGVFTY